MKTPIFVVSDDSSVQVFPDADRAVRPMEAIDVLNGEYQIFDADGLRLEVHADTDNSPIVIREVPGRHPEPDVLRRLLREDLLAVQDVRPALIETGPAGLDGADLPALVAAMETMERRFRERSLTSRLRRRLSGIGRRLARD